MVTVDTLPGGDPLATLTENVTNTFSAGASYPAFLMGNPDSGTFTIDSTAGNGATTSGLFTLTGFDLGNGGGVSVPFSSLNGFLGGFEALTGSGSSLGSAFVTISNGDLTAIYLKLIK